MKKILSLATLFISFYCSGQSITLSPSAAFPFTVKTGGSGAGYYGDISTSGTSGFQYYYVSSTPSSLGTGAGDIFGSASRFGMNSNTSLILRTASLDRMTILSTGKVGIGTSTPVANLDVLGTDNWDLGSGSNGDFRVGTNSYNFRIGVAQGGGGAGTVRLFAPIMIFGVGTVPADRVYMTSTGLGIGAFPTSGLHVHTDRGSGYSYNALVYQTVGSGYGGLGLFNTTGGVILYGNSSGSLNVVAPSGSYAPVNASAFNISSDITVKKEVVNLGLDKYEEYMGQIRNIQSATYRYTWENTQNRITPHIGFIAQSLPDAVISSMDKNPNDSSEKILGYNLSDMSGLAIMGIKALDAKTQQLEAIIKELQAEILKLKNK